MKQNCGLWGQPNFNFNQIQNQTQQPPLTQPQPLFTFGIPQNYFLPPAHGDQLQQPINAIGNFSQYQLPMQFGQQRIPDIEEPMDTIEQILVWNGINGFQPQQQTFQFQQQAISPTIQLQPKILQPIIQPVILQPITAGNEWNNAIPHWHQLGSNTLGDLSGGRGPTIFKSDPEFRSPLFTWHCHPLTGEFRPTGFNPDIISTFVKPPGAELLDYERNMRWTDSWVPKDHLKQVNNKKKDSACQVCDITPNPSGDHYDYYTTREKWIPPTRGPPKISEGIDPLTGMTLLEKFSNPLDKHWKMRPLRSLQHSVQKQEMPSITRNPKMSQYLEMDTIFDTVINRQRSSDSLHNRNSSMKNLNSGLGNASGLLKLSRQCTLDLAPKYRPPRRITDDKSGTQRSKVKLTKPNYYCIPDLATLDKRTSQFSGECEVENFTVGHFLFGKIEFPGIVDVSGLDIDEIVDFGNQKIELYGRTVQPPYGQGLRRRAICTLYNVWPVDRSNKPIKDDEILRSMNFENILKEKCTAFNGKFLSFNSLTGTWRFETSNF